MLTILLIAFTGVAAKNIGGTTLHTGLSFKFGSDQLDFSTEKLDIARKNLENVEVVIGKSIFQFKISPIDGNHLKCLYISRLKSVVPPLQGIITV